MTSSVSLGRWMNVNVRLHMYFLLCSVLVLYLSTRLLPEISWFGLACVLIGFASLLLHEIAHVVAARRLGGVADEIVIGPLGGMTPVRVPFEPQAELVALMAGPLANAFLCFLASAALILTVGPEGSGAALLLNPLATEDLANGSTRELLLKLIFRVNWMLILVNLMPCFPFDGGRCFRAALTFLWPEVDFKQSVLTVGRIGRVAAPVLLIAGCLLQVEHETIVPTWFALSLLAIYVFFGAKHEESALAESEPDEEDVFGYDFSQGYTSLERSVESQDQDVKHVPPPHGNTFSRWLERRREDRDRRQAEREADEEQRVDEILSRLHEGGMHALSKSDRDLLQRVSERYRSRH